MAWYLTDAHEYFISESSVYRILKAHDLITSPQYMVMSAADAFQHPTRCVHELWQTDFTYFRVVGWGWYGLYDVKNIYVLEPDFYRCSSPGAALAIPKTKHLNIIPADNLDMPMLRSRSAHRNLNSSAHR